MCEKRVIFLSLLYLDLENAHAEGQAHLAKSTNEVQEVGIILQSDAWNPISSDVTFREPKKILQD